MAASETLAADIADVKSAMDLLDTQYAATRAVLVTKLAALRALKLAWSPALDVAVDGAGKRLA